MSKRNENIDFYSIAHTFRIGFQLPDLIFSHVSWANRKKKRMTHCNQRNVEAYRFFVCLFACFALSRSFVFTDEGAT